MSDQATVARLWTEALSKPAVTQLRALSNVLADDIAIAGQSGKAAVLEWLKTWPGKSMFRTGQWTEPSVVGRQATVECVFDPRAAYYRGTLTITTTPSGLCAGASLRVAAAPEPLGTVIERVWGPRSRLDALPDHLSATYGTTVAKVTVLDNGVLRVDREDGDPWVVRVFPSDRPLAEVRGDAAVLSFLEQRDFPAERGTAPVSVFEGQGVLVTAFVPGKMASSTTKTVREMADLLGRLHALRSGPRAIRRKSGGLHLYSPDTSVRSEIDTALACLTAGGFRGTDRRRDALLVALSEASDFSGLPTALSHPDLHFKNTIASPGGLVPIDWAGAGQAPRVLALGMVLFYGSQTSTGWDPKRVDAVMSAYRIHVDMTSEELDRLAEAMKHRMLIHEAYSWSVGMATQRKPMSRKDWPHNNPACDAIAEHAARVV